MTSSSTRFLHLFGSMFFLFAGYGLFLNSAGVRLAQMGVSNIAIGALNASFFVGAALSTVAAHRIVSRVGHIRSFGVFGALFAMAALGHLMVNQLWAWGALRAVLGFCYFSLLMVVESWFTERSAPHKRVKVLALYNLVYYVAFTAGIGLLSLKLSSNHIFTLAAILVMAAMLPVGLTRMAEPDLPPRQRISLPRLLSITPLALVGSFLGGLMVNGFFTMSSVFLLQQGMNLKQISFNLTLAMIGGFCAQLPLARLSNRYGRRNIILLCAVLTALVSVGVLLAMWQWPRQNPLPHYVAATVFGVTLFALYSLSLARANDVLPNNMNTVEVSRSLLFSYGLGSLVSPLILGVAMEQVYRYGFYGVYAASAMILLLVAIQQKPVPQAKRSVFVGMPGDTSPVLADLDPRNEAGADEPFDEQLAQQHAEQVFDEAADERLPENDTGETDDAAPTAHAETAAPNAGTDADTAAEDSPPKP
ncbi:MFS family permease [Neisseria sp. HSC-16F19]|nr:MFS transporter [Neisseria sp. HSC-16F19]MCP2040603.1 MFS family permease [Neisseria sp. HSC-16F19]